MENYLKWLDKIGKTKLYIILIVISTIFYMVMGIIINKEAQKIHVDSKDFKLEERTPSDMTFTSQGGSQLFVDYQEVTSWLFGFNGRISITYENETYTYDKTDIREDITITYEDGSQAIKSYDHVSRTYIPVSLELYLLKAIETFRTTKSPASNILMPMLLNLFSFGLIIYPDSFWRMQHMFSVIGGEPTDFALWSNVIGGAFAIIMINTLFWSMI